MNEVYLGLGGNIGDTTLILKAVIKDIGTLPQVWEVAASSIYQTSPVSDIPQGLYVNAACRLKTTLTAEQFLKKLQEIERKHGKVDKPKNCPRVIDIDILFFGTECHHSEILEVPHPRWSERLFVVMPLADLTEAISVPDIQGKITKVNLKQLLESLSKTNIHHEEIRKVPCI